MVQTSQPHSRFKSKPSKQSNKDSQSRIPEQERTKVILLRQLENELKHLHQIDTNQKIQLNFYANDLILDRLQNIAKEAQRLHIVEIQKLCRLAIGKRIFNIELKKKKDQYREKMRKKQQIQLFFRQNRIQRYDYDSLINQKLQNSTFIAKGYGNGKGFVQSDLKYRQKHQLALEVCNFKEVIKNVNKIFYSNYTTLKAQKMDKVQYYLNYIWVPIIIFIFLAASYPYASFYQEDILIIFLFGFIMAVLSYFIVKVYCDKPNHNNQIEQSYFETTEYFQRINKQFEDKGSQIEWKCGDDFMYLEVIFHKGIPH